MLDSKRDIDIKNRLLDSEGDGEGFPCSSAGKESTCNAGNPSSISGSGTSSGEWIGYRLQSSWASQVAQWKKNLPPMQEMQETQV